MSFKDELLTGEHRGPTASGMRMMMANSPTIIERVEMLRRQFLRDIEPLIRMKANAYSLVLTTIIIHQDGRIETEVKLPPVLQEYVDDVDKAIASVHSTYEKLVSRLLP